MNQEQSKSAETSANVIITAHAEFLDDALRELKRLEKQLRDVEILAPGIALCSVPNMRSFPHIVAEARPIFAHHLAPVQAVIKLNNTEADLERLAVTLAEIPTFVMLERGQHFAVQTRM
ncbi:MAG: hypothetical protein ACRDHZ_06565, partial [Ktedonobacteraceae bacterium]